MAGPLKFCCELQGFERQVAAVSHSRLILNAFSRNHR